MPRHSIRQRLVAGAAAALATGVPLAATAQPVRLAASGAWTTFGDTVSAQKTCGVQGDIAGGNFVLFGRSDRPDTLRLTLHKPSWNIQDVTVPIVLSFAGQVTFNLIGTGAQAFIRADIPSDQVKSLIHHFTADNAATLTLPEMHEPPWQFDLRGTTPTIEAMALCLDTALIWLPLPFRQAPPALPATPPPAFVEAPSQLPVAAPAPPPAAPTNIPESASANCNPSRLFHLERLQQNRTLTVTVLNRERIAHVQKYIEMTDQTPIDLFAIQDVTVYFAYQAGPMIGGPPMAVLDAVQDGCVIYDLEGEADELIAIVLGIWHHR